MLSTFQVSRIGPFRAPHRRTKKILRYCLSNDELNRCWNSWRMHPGATGCATVNHNVVASLGGGMFVSPPASCQTSPIFFITIPLYETWYLAAAKKGSALVLWSPLTGPHQQGAPCPPARATCPISGLQRAADALLDAFGTTKPRDAATRLAWAARGLAARSSPFIWRPAPHLPLSYAIKHIVVIEINNHPSSAAHPPTHLPDAANHQHTDEGSPAPGGHGPGSHHHGLLCAIHLPTRCPVPRAF